MLITAGWFTGFIIAITQVTENLSQFSCTLTKTPVVYMDCTHAYIDSISQISNASIIEILNISFIDDLTAFKENDFENFTQLRILEMKGLKLQGENSIPDGLFLPLTLLEHFDITGTSGNYKMPSKLPVGIKYLFVNEMQKTEQFDFSVLENLVEFHMVQTNAKDFPKLSKTAPIVLINMALSHGMDNFHYENISSYCLLKKFFLDQHSQLTQPQHQEQCCGLLKWTETYNIEGINTQIFHCYEPCAKTNVEISSYANNERYECFVRLGLRLRKIWIYLIIALISLLVLAGLGLVSYGVYRRYINPPSIDKYVANINMEEAEELESVSSIEED